MTLEGLQGLLVILGGKVAADFRQIVEGTFTRYMAGDTSISRRFARRQPLLLLFTRRTARRWRRSL
jgi:hypothetical protein